MCTIVLAHRYLRGAPVVLAVNRDERYDRPAEPPHRRDGSPRILAPRDLEAGGTWVGVSDDGLVAAIANRPNASSGARSRGWLVQAALESGTADAASDRLGAELEAGGYAGCYVLVADEGDAILVEWDGEVRGRSVARGLHVLVNAGLDDPPKARAVRRRLRGEPREDLDAWVGRLREVMADHDLGACVHGTDAGTRSSSIVTVTPDGAMYEFADGPPCRNPYRRIDEPER